MAFVFSRACNLLYSDFSGHLYVASPDLVVGIFFSVRFRLKMPGIGINTGSGSGRQQVES